MSLSVHSTPVLFSQNQFSKNKEGASKTKVSPAQSFKTIASDDVLFSGASSSKTPHKTSLWTAGLFTLASLLVPSWAVAERETQSNETPRIHATLKSDHRPTSPTCTDDGQRPLNVDDSLRGLRLISAEQVALTKYLKPRTSRIWALPAADKSTSSLLPEALEMSRGTGFTCQEDGLIVTNHHVVSLVLKEGGSIMVTLGNKSYSATVVDTDELADLAILKIDTKGEKLSTLHFSPEIEHGEIVALMGYPGLENVTSFGTLSALYQLFSSFPKHVTDAPINPGNSGGAATNLKGQMIGHIVTKASNPLIDNQGFLNPTEYLKSALQRLHQGKSIHNRLSLGIMIMPRHEVAFFSDEDIHELFEDDLKRNELKTVRKAALEASELMGEAFGISMAGISPIGPNGEPTIAATSGNFQLGDVIVAVNGQAFQSQAQFLAQVKSIFQDEAFELTVIREGEKITLKFNDNESH